MAFKMNRGNNLGSSPNKLIRMGISKRVRKLFGGKKHIPKKGHYDIDRGLFGPVDWDYTWDRVKDFFGGGKRKRTRGGKRRRSGTGGGGGNFLMDKPSKGKLLPTGIAQHNVGRGGSAYEDDVFKEYVEKRKQRRKNKGTTNA